MKAALELGLQVVDLVSQFISHSLKMLVDNFDAVIVSHGRFVWPEKPQTEAVHYYGFIVGFFLFGLINNIQSYD